MVQEAEQFKVEDEAQRDKVTAKNSLESLAFNMKSTVEDEKLQDKISPEDKKTIVDKCNEVIAWLDRNQVRKDFWLETKVPLLLMLHQWEGNHCICSLACKLAKDSNTLLRLYRVYTIFCSFYLFIPRQQRRMSMSTSRKNLRKCATPSSPSYTRGACQGVCQEECQEECLVASLVEQEGALLLVQLLRRLTEHTVDSLSQNPTCINCLQARIHIK